jgi:transposase
LSRAAQAIESPYDTQAKHSSKRDTVWTGYKVHVSETCEPDEVHLITHVHTTVATTQDVSCTKDIHQGLKGKDLLPGMHLVDTGYVDADLLVSSKDEFGVDLLGPTRLNPSWQAREGGYDQTQFAVDWEKQQATCPQGKVSSWWGADTAKVNSSGCLGGSSARRVKVRFDRQDCACCPQRDKCVRSKTGRARTLVLSSQAEHEALRHARERIRSEEGRTEYQRRAGIEGTLSQGVRCSGMRRSRYWGLSKTHLQHVATAAALNIGRVVAHWEGHKPAKTQVSRFARSKPVGIMVA